MDAQSLINILVGACNFFGGWMINSLSRSIIRVEDKLSELPLIYVTKDDYRDGKLYLWDENQLQWVERV